MKNYDSDTLINEIKLIENKMRLVVQWIQHEYTTFKPTDGAVDVRAYELSRRLNEYAYYKIRHEELSKTYEQRMMMKGSK